MGEVLHGIPVSPGVGVGPAVVLRRTVPEPPDEPTDETADAAVTRALAALADVAADLVERGSQAGGEAKAVLEAQALMAQDPGLADAVRGLIASGKNAARAVHEAFGTYREVLAGAGEYMAARVADLDDVRDRTVARLLGLPMPGPPTLTRPAVIVAHDLAPADTAAVDHRFVAGFVTVEGGPTSHTAILARSMGVPAVLGCAGAAAIADGATLLVDGSAGTVTVEPSPDAAARATAAATARLKAAASVTGPGATADGHRISLLLNVGGVADAPAAGGAEGIGLFRTEFAFLGRTTMPTEEEQRDLYRKVFAAFSGMKVVARVLDAGSDKPLAFLDPMEEPNPALGLRGLRLLLRETDLLAGQLRALRSAALDTGVLLEVMAPMVADAEDARAFSEACRLAGLTEPVGVMIETPSAALGARAILAHADFLSIGTNDLAQYTFAADRLVSGLARYQDPWQPALLKLVAAAAAAAQEAGKPCGVCGEAASDPALACVLVGLGVTSLSMTGGSIPFVRSVLAAHTLAECQAGAAVALAGETAEASREAARNALPHLR